MRVILDANVVIAAAATRGLCEALLELCLEQHSLIFCDGILVEIDEKLRSKLKVPSTVIAGYLNLLQSNAEFFVPEKIEQSACRDPKDLMILGLVIPSKADVIVTGDKDLLVIKKFHEALIMNPRNFWEFSRGTN